MVDNVFILAILAFGWGLSLATYRLFARRNGWPMGALQADLPPVPVLLGLASLVAGVIFAADRAEDGARNAAWLIIGFGVLFAIFWTGFLRVGSQISLFLAPIATVLLLVGWLGAQYGYDRAAQAIEHPKDFLPKVRIERREPVPAPNE